jgi:hypothetical protein
VLDGQQPQDHARLSAGRQPLPGAALGEPVAAHDRHAPRTPIRTASSAPRSARTTTRPDRRRPGRERGPDDHRAGSPTPGTAERHGAAHDAGVGLLHPRRRTTRSSTPRRTCRAPERPRSRARRGCASRMRSNRRPLMRTITTAILLAAAVASPRPRGRGDGDRRRPDDLGLLQRVRGHQRQPRLHQRRQERVGQRLRRSCTFQVSACVGLSEPAGCTRHARSALKTGHARRAGGLGRTNACGSASSVTSRRSATARRRASRSSR